MTHTRIYVRLKTRCRSLLLYSWCCCWSPLACTCQCACRASSMAVATCYHNRSRG